MDISKVFWIVRDKFEKKKTSFILLQLDQDKKTDQSAKTVFKYGSGGVEGGGIPKFYPPPPRPALEQK